MTSENVRADPLGERAVVCVAGGIAAYKAVELVRELLREGVSVRVAMTPNAARFVGTATFTGITGQPVFDDLWETARGGEPHVELGAWADAVVVAPATAGLMAGAAQGFASDPVLATLSCTDAPVLMAPAMHTRMWNHPATQNNARILRERGVTLVGPVEGELASGDVGPGRMAEPEAIASAVIRKLRTASDLEGRNVVVTAGPTHEDLDPVRFLGNRSSGRMGHALADRARARGANVTLITGPVELPAPPGVEVVRVRSALEMHAAITHHADRAEAVIMAAAVADYRPRVSAPRKIKKGDGPRTLELVRNPDILETLGQARRGRSPVLVGFALDSLDPVADARAKLDRKRCDLVVANHADTALGGERNHATLVDHTGEKSLPELSKLDLADRILERVAAMLASD